MAKYKRVALLIFVMTAVVLAATATAISLLYRTAYERERLQLVGNVQSQARMMEAMARFDESHRQLPPASAGSAPLAQIRDAYSRQPAVGNTAELTVARRAGDQIVFLMRHRHEETGRPEPVPWDSPIAEPMRRALTGESGTMVGLDYHGERVLAAYEPVSGVDLGVVAKIDLAEIRGPFLRAATIVVGIALVLVIAGTLIFIRVTNPMIQALRDREQKLELLLSSTSEGIFGMDVEGRCTFANRSAVEQLGYSDAGELMGRDMHELIHHTRPDGTPHPREECSILLALQRDEPVLVEEETLWRADGSSFPAEYRAQPMRRDGQLVGTVATFVDITERKTRELELLHAQKLEVLGQLTGGIAHDFNNLLTVILGNLRFLSEDDRLSDDEEFQELVEDALSAAQDGADLTQRLLAFSRKQSLEPLSLELNAYIRESAGFIHRLIGEDIKLELDLRSGSLWIEVDKAHLHSALLNLAVNSRDAMPAGGKLSISTGRATTGPRHGPDNTGAVDVVVLRVSDSGVGMSPKAVEKAVEPFFTTKEPGKGSGLGLSMVYGFARQSGGRAEISSEPGVGTTVTLYLPAAEAEVYRESQGLMPDAVRAEGETVLVAEDDSRLRKFVRRSLQNLGFRVLVAGDAAEARELLLAYPGKLDILFSDIVMPGDMDGRELACWALARWPGLKILLTTGFSRELFAEGVEQTFPILRKPYGQKELQAALAGILGRPLTTKSTSPPRPRPTTPA